MSDNGKKPTKYDSTLAEADALRAQLSRTVKQIGNLVIKKDECIRAIASIENNCKHDWGAPKPKKNRKDIYERQCRTCGKTQESKNVQVKF